MLSSRTYFWRVHEVDDCTVATLHVSTIEIMTEAMSFLSRNVLSEVPSSSMGQIGVKITPLALSTWGRDSLLLPPDGKTDYETFVKSETEVFSLLPLLKV